MSDNVPPLPVTASKTITDAYLKIKGRIDKACRVSGRKAGSVSLTCVTKTQDWDNIVPVLALGHRQFGENRVQEAQIRWAGRKTDFPDLYLSLIGPLQTNKVKEAVALFDRIETVDRPKLADALHKEMAAQNRHLELYVQINIGQEPQKAGIDPMEALDFITYCRNLGLSISGLMAIPPVARPTGPYFALLTKLAHEAKLSKLSMGMSEDYETAISFGATEVRIGSAIFGARPKPE